MTQAIQTKFLSPTNHRGARISAKCDAGKIVVQWDYSMNPDRNHAHAAKVLVTKLGWDGQWVSGGLPDGSVVHVPVRSWNDFTIEAQA